MATKQTNIINHNQLKIEDTCHMHKSSIEGLQNLINEYNIQNVLEFGSGYSSYWFAKRVKQLYTIDTNSNWFPQNLINTECYLLDKNGKNIENIINKINHINFDLVLIDCKGNLRPKIFEYMQKINWKILSVHDYPRDKEKYNKNLFSNLQTEMFNSLKIWIK